MKLSTKQLAHAYVKLADGRSDTDLKKAAEAFVDFLRERGELYRYRDILSAVDAVWKETYGAATITIASAHPLSKSAKQALESQAKGAAIIEEVDEALIGGARVRIDDRIFDGSIAGKLTALKHQLKTA